MGDVSDKIGLGIAPRQFLRAIPLGSSSGQFLWEALTPEKINLARRWLGDGQEMAEENGGTAFGFFVFGKFPKTKSALNFGRCIGHNRLRHGEELPEVFLFSENFG